MVRIIAVALSVTILIGCGAQMRSAKGWDYLKENKNEAAIVEFKTAMQGRPLPGSYGGLYKAYMNMNDYENARKYLDEGLSRFPEDAFLNFAAGDFHLNVTKNYDLSIFHLKKAQTKLSNPTIDRTLREAERLKTQSQKN
jgi:tetratricopeptide (TPR) repeat protein